jgi:sucrose-6-phosphate hydrolase SacC (GH32 family)
MTYETIAEWTAPFRDWYYYPDHVIGPDIDGHPAVEKVDVPTVYRLPDEDSWYMSVVGYDGQGYRSFVAESDDLRDWSTPQLAMGYGPEDTFDHGGCVLGGYLYESYDIAAPRTLKRRDGSYWSLYGAYPRQGGYELRPGSQGLARSDDGRSWERATADPILSVYQPECDDWEASCIYQPWLVEHEGRCYNFYNAANGRVERIGLATSPDLHSWTRYGENPVVSTGPALSYNELFSADPKVYRQDDHWVMLFYGVGRDGAHIMIAFSRNLRDWVVDPEPLYRAGGHPTGLDADYAHKVSLVFDPDESIYYMFYTAVGDEGRGVGLLTSEPLEGVSYNRQ